MCGLGTWEYIGEHVTLPRLAAFQRYWKSNPPVHILVAAYMGVGAKNEKPAQKVSDSDLEMLMKMYPGTTPWP